MLHNENQRLENTDRELKVLKDKLEKSERLNAVYKEEIDKQRVVSLYFILYILLISDTLLFTLEQ